MRTEVIDDELLKDYKDWLGKREQNRETMIEFLEEVKGIKIEKGTEIIPKQLVELCEHFRNFIVSGAKVFRDDVDAEIIEKLFDKVIKEEGYSCVLTFLRALEDNGSNIIKSIKKLLEIVRVSWEGVVLQDD